VEALRIRGLSDSELLWFVYLESTAVVRLRRRLQGVPILNALGTRAARWLAGARPKVPPPMPFIVGVPRSGTTLLRLMLDAHPDLAIPPETGWMPLLSGASDREKAIECIAGTALWPDYHLPREAFERHVRNLEPFDIGETARVFYRQYAARFAKSRWGDKTPVYSLHMETIERILPEARFIHIIRDGRDVATSVRTLWFRPADTLEAIARDWRDRILAARASAAGRRFYLEVRYEDLIQRTGETLRRICDFVELPFDTAMLSHHHRARERLAEHESVDFTGRVISKEQRLAQQRSALEPPDRTKIGRWREVLTDAERSECESVAGVLLRELGYTT